MRIFYFISLLILLFSLLFLRRQNKKIDFIITLVFVINVIYFSHLFFVYILSLFNLKESFLLLSIINIFFSAFLIFLNKRKYKKILFQEYEFKIKEIVFLCAIALICFMIGFYRFGQYKEISYETTDPALHYKTAVIYSQQLQLLTRNNSQDELYVSFNHGMTGFYVNCGLLMNLFDKIPSYKIYLLFDTFILFLLAGTFYATCLKIKKTKQNDFVLFIISLLYLGGYALNSLIFGFGYLGPGILATNLVILTWIMLDEEKDIFIKKNLYLTLFLFNYGIFFSYYLFVPAMYFGQGLYIIYKFYKKEYSLKESIKVGSLTLVIPFVIGMIYFILPAFFKSEMSTLSNVYASEGYIYRDLWSNFILIIPLLLYSIIYFVKKKKIDLFIILFIVLFAFLAGTFIFGFRYNKISSYYYYKSYYILWPIVYLIIARLVNIQDFNSILFFKINVYFVVFVLIIMLSNVEKIIQEKNNLFNNSFAAASVSNIYLFNSNKIVYNNPILNIDELKLIEKAKKYSKDCINSNGEFPVIAGTLKKLWFYSLTNIVPIYNHKSGDLSKFYDEDFDIDLFEKDNSSNCIIIFSVDEIEIIDKSKYEAIYKNNSGVILKKISSEV